VIQEGNSEEGSNMAEVMDSEEVIMTDEIVMPSKPVDKNREMVKKMLDGCLKHGLAALCKAKPEEPIKWLAHWLLENNPNQPRVCFHCPFTSYMRSCDAAFEARRAVLAGLFHRGARCGVE